MREIRLLPLGVRVAVAGAVYGALVAVLFGSGAATFGSVGRIVTGTAAGALLGLYPLDGRMAWIVSVAFLTATAFAGDFALMPAGGDTFAPYLIVAAHTLFAAYYDERLHGVPAAVAFGLVGALSIRDSSDSPFIFLFIVPATWAAGRELRVRARLAERLEQRARELDEEREAHARLSVRYERARIASELHDIVAHAISVMVIQASAGQRLVDDPELTAETFETIASAARQAEADIGRLAELLATDGAIGPAPDLGLVEELVRRAAGSGLDVTLALEGDREGLPAVVTETAYRVVQEGLTNALRYAAGGRVSVRVAGRDGALVVELVNGPGRAALSDAGTGNGLRGLRERVGACGGTLDAGPVAGGAWRVRAVMPLRAEALRSGAGG